MDNAPQAATKRIVLGVQYDGAPWQGWQIQPHGITVQDCLERALEKFACMPIATVCAGRTDAGVHGLGQIVHFDTPIVREMASWVRGVNAFLPPSVCVRWATSFASPEPGQVQHVAHDFHARFSAISRTYHYLIYNHPVRSPLMAGRAGWVFRPLDAEVMHAAAQHLVGEHDFTSFRSVECQANTPVRTMTAISVERQGDYVLVTLKANAFLHHMVRNIVGSLVFIGTGKRPVGWLGDLLVKRDRSLAAPTFMPDGLYLAHVEYPAQWALPQEATRQFLPMGSVARHNG